MEGDRLKAYECRIEELEEGIASLKRQVLLPCKLCSGHGVDGGDGNVRQSLLEQVNREVGRVVEGGVEGVDMAEWEKLADTILLIEPIWERSKCTKLENIRPYKENLDLDPLDLVYKSNGIIRDLQGHLDRCERLRNAAREADSSLFSLFPFSAGTFQRVAWNETRDNGLAEHGSHQHTSHDLKTRGVALEVASDLMMDMARTLLNQRLELNAYIEELFEKTIEKDRALTDTVRLSNVGKVDEFVHEQDFEEEDATEVEL
mmetsp:Transcript_15165/g.24635  ORF Transcript_15165/g.24635 Transcript_15165/m.24635 type:complete len:260 (+) Transcript_15165:109-888(+)